MTGDPLATFCADVRQFSSGRHMPWRVFADFVELATISLSQPFVRSPVREERYAQILRPYSGEEANALAKLLAFVVEGLERDQPNPDDFLGRAFMRLELNDHWKGQYFTPMPVARCMAEMNIADTGADQPEILTACDPACGSGVMIIALANALRAAGVNYQHRLHVTAQDIDATAAHMAFIQLALLHVPAIVVVGDSLMPPDRPEAQRDVYYTPAHCLGFWSAKLRRRAGSTLSSGDAVRVEPAPVTAPAPARQIQLGLFGGGIRHG